MIGPPVAAKTWFCWRRGGISASPVNGLSLSCLSHGEVFYK